MALATKIERFNVTPRIGKVGTGFIVDGQLWGEYDSFWRELFNKTIKVDSNEHIFFGQLQTDYYGKFSLKCYVYKSGTYQVYAKFEGDAEYAPCTTGVITVIVEKEVPTKKNCLIIGWDVRTEEGTRQGVAPCTVYLRGKLSDSESYVGLANKEVLMCAGSRLLKKVKTQSDGSFEWDHFVDVGEGAYFAYWAKFEGDAEYNGCESARITVLIEEPEEPPPEPDEDHTTGISITSYPMKAEPNQSFEVEIAVICLTAGCNLMGKTIQVKDEEFNLEGSGTLTTKSWNARYGKYEYRGRVVVRAPETAGSYQWYGMFPKQNNHAGVSNSFTFEVTGQVQPTEATHALKCGFRNIGGYSQAEIKSKVESIIVPLVNGVLLPMGWTYCGVEVYGDYFEIYYHGSPLEPVTWATITTIFTLVVIAMALIVIVYVAWVFLETKKIEAEIKKGYKELLEEGYIDEETYKKLMEMEAEEDWWEKLMGWLPMLLVFLIIASIAGALRRD